jgi:hypothetical protein
MTSPENNIKMIASLGALNKRTLASRSGEMKGSAHPG